MRVPYTSNMSERKPVAAVVGVGPGNGLALAHRFDAAGYRLALLSRSRDRIEGYAGQLGDARAFAADAADPPSLTAAFREAADHFGGIDMLLYNAGTGVWGRFDELSADDFEHSWRVNALGLAVAAQAVAPTMIERGAGAIAVTGAGAAWRGRPATVAFAQAKAAQRSIAESLARQLGPFGVHVFYAVIDGVVDLPSTRERMPDKPDAFFLQPDDIAAAIFATSVQPRSAWTFELDLRPFGENW